MAISAATSRYKIQRTPFKTPNIIKKSESAAPLAVKLFSVVCLSLTSGNRAASKLTGRVGPGLGGLAPAFLPLPTSPSRARIISHFPFLSCQLNYHQPSPILTTIITTFTITIHPHLRPIRFFFSFAIESIRRHPYLQTYTPAAYRSADSRVP